MLSHIAWCCILAPGKDGVQAFLGDTDVLQGKLHPCPGGVGPEGSEVGDYSDSPTLGFFRCSVDKGLMRMQGQLSSRVCLLIPLALVTEIPSQKLSGTITLIICVGHYKFSKIPGPRWQYPLFNMGSSFQPVKPSGNQTWCATGQRLPMLPWWGPPSVWKCQ